MYTQVEKNTRTVVQIIINYYYCYFFTTSWNLVLEKL